mgnify:CR=1 FL=1
MVFTKIEGDNLNWIKEKVLPKFKAFVSKKETEEILWIKCESCSQMIFHKEYTKNFNVCKSCGHHGYINTTERLNFLYDENTIEKIDINTITDDPLNFKDIKRYSDRIKDARKKTNIEDAIVCAFGTINKIPCVTACFDFAFMGGSMGRYVGNTILKASEEAVNRKCSLILIPSSGGARMQEGIYSLMQLPRSIIGINKLKDNFLPYIVLMSNPTTGGVTASFAMLGDIHIAEPGAIIGFAGKRVIEKTVKESLPENFQKSEYLLEHGMVDIVIPRQEQKKKISKILKNLTYKIN